MAYYADPAWAYWQGQTTSATTNINIWNNWNHQYQTPNVTYAATTDIWTYWNTNYLTTGTNNIQVVNPAWVQWNQPAYTPPVRTAEQIRADAKRLQEQRERADKQVKLRNDATRRAQDLLFEHLTDEQKQDYRDKRHFDVEVEPGKFYRVAGGTHGNVTEIHKVDGRDVRVRSFCIPSRIQVPEPDVHLAQKLMIEGAMEEFHRIANISTYRPDLVDQEVFACAG